VTTLYLIRGLPGTGKTTMGEKLIRYTRAHPSWNDGIMVAADDYFYCEDGVYRFDPKLLPLAHADCQFRASIGLRDGKDVVVHNTFSQRWEMQEYIDMAEKSGVRLVVLDLFDAGCTDEQLTERNSHGVPLHAIQRMRERWEHDWRAATPTQGR